MKCSICRREAKGLTTFVNAANFKATYVCVRCQASNMVQDINDPKEIDTLLDEYREMSERMESVIEKHPEMPQLPPILAALAMTPISVYEGVQFVMAELKVRRMELMTQTDSKERLKYELEKALQAEDYERAALIRDKLNAIAAAKPKRTRKRKLSETDTEALPAPPEKTKKTRKKKEE